MFGFARWTGVAVTLPKPKGAAAELNSWSAAIDGSMEMPRSLGSALSGADRACQEMCRDICVQRTNASFQPYRESDGIDVSFGAGGTVWRFDVVRSPLRGGGAGPPLTPGC